MRAVLLGLAAATLFSNAPAVSAPALSGGGFSASSAFSSGSQSLTPSSGIAVHRGGGRWDDQHGDREHRRHPPRDGYYDGAVYAGGWGDVDFNRSWDSDSYNDWWHDRPDRAFPRWMSTNQNCERQYWTGSGWRC